MVAVAILEINVWLERQQKARFKAGFFVLPQLAIGVGDTGLYRHADGV